MACLSNRLNVILINFCLNGWKKVHVVFLPELTSKFTYYLVYGFWIYYIELMRFTNKATSLLICCINYSFRLIRIFVQQNLLKIALLLLLFFIKIRMVEFELQDCILTCSFFFLGCCSFYHIFMFIDFLWGAVINLVKILSIALAV